ncbi:MAG TPA: hypothetical protein ACFYEK_17935 [Candidatus Wunengus sp. YC60]|uniref:hypothetical protein n=1 Tax=Candidatus Wunengus sp. YC60 TaxID=3367697 RepID=UPI004025FEC7
MKKEAIIKAVTAARILINREKELTADDYRFLGICGSKRTSALRRASMELTRALADLRR